MKKFLIIALLSTLCLPVIAQREVQNINRNWSFSPGWEVRRDGVAAELINLPHTWNLDALSAKKDYQRTMGNYLRDITIPKAWQGRKVYLKFYGANQVCEVYINARRVGAHSGGYTAFGFDITPYLNYGVNNTIWVRVTNALNLDVMPLVGDFNVYGGIYRDVELIVTPTEHISHTAYATSGVAVTPLDVSDQAATITVSTTIEGLAGRFCDVRFVLRDADQIVIDSMVRRIKIEIEGSNQIAWNTTIAEPHLWNGTIDPYRYSVDVVTQSAGGKTFSKSDLARDSIREYFGLRFFEVDDKNQFLLNGKPYELRGVGRHQDYAMLGNALYRDNHRRDIALIAEMGANAVRLTNYPQDQYFIELCDIAGIVVWSEIPFVGPGSYRDTGFNNSDLFKQNGERQLTEMIRQLYNHPSVIFLGLFSELTQRGEDPLQYVKYLNSVVKEEDPDRLTVAASNQDGELNLVTDLIGFNQYMGWSSGMPSDIDAWGTAVRRDWPKLKVGLSEYGAGASIYDHQDSLVRPVVESYWHPEEWQTYFHQQYWRTIATKKFFWGTFISSMFDFGSASRTQGTRAGINDNGLVTFDRSVKKDAFYFYKANWNPKQKFVYITSRRYSVRSGTIQSFKVFSPCAQVRLLVNGVEQGVVKNDGFGTFVWKGCKLRIGDNIVEAVCDDGLSDRIQIQISN